MSTPSPSATPAAPGAVARFFDSDIWFSFRTSPMAIVAAEAGVQAKILATDIDEEVLEHTRRGVYDESRLDPLSAERRLRFFERSVGPLDGLYRVKATTRAMVDARSLNLVGPWVMREPVDALFCRNVFIYCCRRCCVCSCCCHCCA